MTFEQLREEYRAERIGQLVYREVQEAVATLTRGYDPRIYGGAVSWADAREDVVQGVITEMLLGEGQLDYIFAQASTLDDFRALLFFQAKRYLARNRQRTVIDNLLKRAKDILSVSPFAPAGTAPALYRLEGAEKEDRPATEEELRSAARFAAVVPTVAFNVSERAPIVYSRENLISVLKIVADRLPCSFSIHDLQKIFDLLLTDWVPGFLGEVEEEQSALYELSPEEEVQVSDAYHAILGDLAQEEQAIFRAAILKQPDREVASELNVSRQTVIARRQRLFERLQPVLSGLEERVQAEVIGRVGVSLTLAEGDQQHE